MSLEDADPDAEKETDDSVSYSQSPAIGAEELQQISSKRSTRVVPEHQSSQVATVLHQAEISCIEAVQSRRKRFQRY